MMRKDEEGIIYINSKIKIWFIIRPQKQFVLLFNIFYTAKKEKTIMCWDNGIHPYHLDVYYPDNRKEELIKKYNITTIEEMVECSVEDFKHNLVSRLSELGYREISNILPAEEIVKALNDNKEMILNKIKNTENVKLGKRNYQVALNESVSLSDKVNF